MPDPARRRAELLAAIAAEAAATGTATGRSRLSDRVLAALGRVPRHRFVPPELEAAAYLDAPLGIGHGQTISQPFIVALMTELLDLPAAAKVLEIGCGSGYQAAVLAELGAAVVSIERIAELAAAARIRLQELGYPQVEVRTGDGYFGCSERAPYEAIIVTAAIPDVPPPLLEQLAPGGRLVIPLGQPGEVQELVRVEKRPDGRFDTRSILPVAFVPFVRGGGEAAGTKPA